MAVSTFGVTPASVQSLFLPQIPGFSALTKPTADAVEDMIDQAAAQLEGRLYGENIAASGITTVTSAAYIMCAEQLGRMVALRVLKVLSQKFPELAKEYQREVDWFWKMLGEKGGTFLGDSGLESGNSPADGPTSHVSENGLEQQDSSDMSTVIPPLRKDDRL